MVKRFEYMKVGELNERRFDNISLPQIASNNKRAPTFVKYGASTTNTSLEGRLLPGVPSPKTLKFMGSRDYSPKYNLI